MARSWHRTLLCSVGLVVAFQMGAAIAADDEPAMAIKPVPGMGAGGAMAADAPVPTENSLGLSAAPATKYGETCDDGCSFGGKLFCGDPGRFWFRADYVYYWTSGMVIPPLVATGPVNAGLTAATDPAGSLGRADTTVLYGNGTILSDGRSGFHFNTGVWFDKCQTCALVFDWLDLGPQDAHFTVSSNASGAPVLTRPYYDVQAGREWRQLVSYPGTLSGSATVDSEDYFNSAGVAIRKRCFGPSCHDCGPTGDCDGCPPAKLGCGLDLIVGYRYYGLSDHITIQENLLSLSAPTAGTRIQVTDKFRAANQFHGADLGLSTDLTRGRWTLTLLMKAALGNNYQTVNIAGQTVRTDSVGNSITDQAGVFANRANIGTYHRNDFVVIPELGIEVGYLIGARWRATFGYNLIYWASVQRSGDAIDLDIDPRNIPGGLESTATHFPQFEFCGTNYWAQGLRAGLEFRF